MGTEETDPALGLIATFQPTRYGSTPHAVSICSPGKKAMRRNRRHPDFEVRKA